MLRAPNPYTGEPTCEVPYDEPEDVEHDLALAVATQKAWRRVPVDERVRRVSAGLGWFRDHAEEIARDVTRQMGKPIVEARAEVRTFFERAEHMLAIAADALAPDELPPKPGLVRRIEHEPLGVVLNIAAWNYPLLLPVNVVIPALVAGNVVLLKHSATTPLVGQHFERAFGELDPPGLVTSLVLTHAATVRLVGDERIDHVAFTGSVEGGRAVHEAAAGRFVGVGLELGGKDPAYVAQDADLDFVVPNVVEGACYNAGQSCCAVERVYVHRKLYDEFLDRACEAVRAYRTGDPMVESTTLGPLAHARAAVLVEEQVRDAVRRGAKVLAGGERLDRHAFQATVLADCPHDSDVMQDETFGPLVPCRAVSGDDEALARMNDSRYGLTASVWTRDLERAERFARELDAGTVYMNRCDYLDPALPWTGVRDSGRGTTLSRYGFWTLTRRKAVHLRLSP